MSNSYSGTQLSNGLFYSDDEILCLYKEAKDKRIQMKILAEMNLCTVDDIRTALLRAGIDGRALPRKSKKLDIDIDIELNTNNDCINIQEQLKDMMDLAHNAIATYQNMLLKQKSALEGKISNLESEISKYHEILDKCDVELAKIDKLLSKEI